MQFTDTEKYFVSEASVYRILKSHDLITSPAYVVLSAADEIKDKTTRPFQLWYSPDGSRVVNNASGLCMDVRANVSGGQVVIATCGTAGERPFLQWATY